MNLALIAALIATFHVPYALDSFDETKPVEMAALDEPAIEQIRLEIRRLLPATWTIAADGNIKTMKIEGVTDRDFAVCLARAGNRPFPVKPGMEVTIPVPVVFVR